MSVRNAGKTIREARIKAGLTQEQLSEGVCSVLSLSRIENGSAGVSPVTFQALMAHAGAPCEVYPIFASRTDFDCFYTLNRARFYLGSWQLSQAYEELNKLEEWNFADNKLYYQEYLYLNGQIQVCSGCADHHALYDLFSSALHITRPEIDYSESDINSILAHESYHIKKNHNLIKGVLNIICCMYWWFIPIYFFKKYIFLYLEMKTDDSIIQNLDEKESFAYMQTLIQIQKQSSQKSFTSYISSNGFILNYRIHYMMRGLHKKKTNAFILVSTILICFLSTFINISGYYTNTELTENTFEITNSNAYIFENKNNPPSLLFYLDNQYILGGYTNLKEIQDEQKLPTYKDLGKTRNIQSITNTQNTVIKNSKQTTYRWKYKLEDGYVYRRLYNACKNTWVSDWMSA